MKIDDWFFDLSEVSKVLLVSSVIIFLLFTFDVTYKTASETVGGYFHDQRVNEIQEKLNQTDSPLEMAACEPVENGYRCVEYDNKNRVVRAWSVID